MGPLRTERHTRFPGAKAGGQIGKLGAASPCRLTAAQAALLAPKAIVTATIFAAIDFIIKFLQIKKARYGRSGIINGFVHLIVMVAAGEGATLATAAHVWPISAGIS